MWFIPLISRPQLLLHRMESTHQSLTRGQTKGNSSWLLITKRRKKERATFGLQSHLPVPKVSWHRCPFLLSLSVPSTLCNCMLTFSDIFVFIDFKERERKGEREKERSIDLLFYLFMHSSVASCMCPNRGSNLQLWCIEMMLQPTELPSEGWWCI